MDMLYSILSPKCKLNDFCYWLERVSLDNTFAHIERHSGSSSRVKGDPPALCLFESRLIRCARPEYTAAEDSPGEKRERRTRHPGGFVGWKVGDAPEKHARISYFQLDVHTPLGFILRLI